MKKNVLLFIICFASTLLAQNITNTLGSSGLFYVKDASTTFLTLKQSNGYLGLGIISPTQQLELSLSLELPATTSSTTGVIYKGTNRFIHNFKATGTSGSNTFVGINAGNFTMVNNGAGIHASTNTGIGASSLASLTTGYNNTAVGYASLNLNTTGYENTAVGVAALLQNTTGIWNVALGWDASYSNTIGEQNTALGKNAMRNNISGSYNTAVGKDAFYNNKGSNNTAIGKAAGYNLTTGTNCLILGSNANASTATVSNEITLGNSAITTLRCQVTSITSLSDIRDKKNIKDLSLGLNFLMKLQPRQFNWDKREWYKNNKPDGTKMKTIPTAGFIAQELDKIQVETKAEWLNLVYKSNPNKWEATYGNLIPVIVKSIQELKLQNDELLVKNEQLKKQLYQISDFYKEVKEIKQLKAELAKQLKLVKDFNKNEKIVSQFVGN